MDLTFTEYQFRKAAVGTCEGRLPSVEHADQSTRLAECIAHAQRCRQLAETARSHSIRQMLVERAMSLEAQVPMFNFGGSTD
jgi:hypothetical protein